MNNAVSYYQPHHFNCNEDNSGISGGAKAINFYITTLVGSGNIFLFSGSCIYNVPLDFSKATASGISCTPILLSGTKIIDVMYLLVDDAANKKYRVKVIFASKVTIGDVVPMHPLNKFDGFLYMS